MRKSSKERAKRTKRRARNPRPVPTHCFNISGFCAAHNISQAHFFRLKSLGFGPREMHVGNRILISFESAAQWRAEREAATAAAGEAAE